MNLCVKLTKYDFGAKRFKFQTSTLCEYKHNVKEHNVATRKFKLKTLWKTLTINEVQVM